MKKSYPFVYQCEECGNVSVIRWSNVKKLEGQYEYEGDRADEALEEKEGWKSARPSSICSNCGE